MKYSTMGIMLTRKCSAKCKVCCFKCSMENDEVIDKLQIIKYIESSKDIVGIDTIGFTGGEAFLYFDLLLELVKLCSLINKKSTVSTNAFWAGTEIDAKEKMIRLKEAGLFEIGVSYDEYHKDFIPPKNIKNYIDVAKSLNYTPIIQSIFSDYSKTQWLLDIDTDLSDVILHFIPCYPVGSAKNYFKNYIQKTCTNNLYCRKTGTYLVTCDGTIWPCCSPYVIETALNIGHIGIDSVSSTLEKLNRHIVLSKLRKFGFNYFINLIKRYNIDIKLPQYVISSCELCALFFNQSNITKFLPFVLRERDY